MSIVSVHGPQTFGSKAVAEAGAVMATVDPTNGLKWDFKLDAATTRPDQDFSWAFPPNGTPTPQALADPTVVTYATAGSKTATLTVTNTPKTVTNKALTSNVATLSFAAAPGFKVGQTVVVSGVGAPFDGTFTVLSVPGSTITYACVAANVTSAASTGTVTSDPAQYPPAGSYPITITAVAGAGPLMAPMESGGGGEEPPPEIPVGYDPGAHTVSEVQQYISDHPDQLDEMYEAEVAGKNRSTLVTWMEGLMPYDPGAYTVQEVLDYAADNPSELEDIIAAEQAGKARSTLLTQLEAMRA